MAMEELIRDLYEALDDLGDGDLRLGKVKKNDDGKTDRVGKRAAKEVKRASQDVAKLYRGLIDVPRTPAEILEDAMKALLGKLCELINQDHLDQANKMIASLRRITDRCVTSVASREKLRDLLDKLSAAKNKIEKTKFSKSKRIHQLISHIRFFAQGGKLRLEEGRNVNLGSVEKRIREGLKKILKAIQDGNLYAADLMIEVLRREIEKNIAGQEKSDMLGYLTQLVEQKYAGFLQFNARSFRSYLVAPSELLDRRYAEIPLQKISSLPLHAVKGISSRRANLLTEALGTRTIGSLVQSSLLKKVAVLHELGSGCDRFAADSFGEVEDWDW